MEVGGTRKAARPGERRLLWLNRPTALLHRPEGMIPASDDF
jgi:hypothetical protein